MPVGEDQKQHLELARDIAAKFNHDYKRDVFPIVEPLIFGTASRIMSLKDGTSKMSKSDASDLSRINMTDDTDAIARKIKKAKTDADALPSEVEGLKGRAEAANLVGIYAALANSDVADVLGEFGGQGFGTFKPALADLAVDKLSPIQNELRRLLGAPETLDAVLRSGAERARTLAEPILKEVQDTVGFLHP